MCRANRHADAYIPGEMHVRHDRHMLHIGSATKALDRILHFTFERIC